MNRARTLGGFFGLLLGTMVLTSLRGEELAPKPETPDLDALVRQLGSDDFHLREKASQELFRIGLPAREALQRGARDVDREIRRRCQRLLPAIAEAERQAKIEAFLADKDGKQKHDLPGWTRYRKMVGDDEAARRFFVVLHKADGPFLAEAEKNPDKAGPVLIQREQRFQSLGNASTPIPLEEIALLLFVASDPKVKIPDGQAWQFCNLLRQQRLRSELRSSRLTPCKKIILAWMEQQVQLGDDSISQNIFRTLNELELKEGLELALRVVRDKKVKSSALAQALATIGRLGDKQHWTLLEAHLDDTATVCSFGMAGPGFNVQGTTQVRDVALGMLVRGSKQSFKDYGFAAAKADRQFVLNHAEYLGFSSDKERDAALAKWKEWKAAQKK